MPRPPPEKAFITPGPVGCYDYEHPYGFKTDLAEAVAASITLLPGMYIIDLQCRTGNLACALKAKARAEGVDINLLAVAPDQLDVRLARQKLVRGGLATSDEAAETVICHDELTVEEIRERHAPNGFDLICCVDMWEICSGADAADACARASEEYSERLHNLSGTGVCPPSTIYTLIPGRSGPICGMTEVMLKGYPSPEWSVVDRTDTWFAEEVDFTRARSSAEPYMAAVRALPCWTRVSWRQMPTHGPMPSGPCWRDDTSTLRKTLSQMHASRAPDMSSHAHNADPENRRRAKDAFINYSMACTPPPINISCSPNPSAGVLFGVVEPYPIYCIIETTRDHTGGAA